VHVWYFFYKRRNVVETWVWVSTYGYSLYKYITGSANRWLFGLSTCNVLDTAPVYFGLFVYLMGVGAIRFWWNSLMYKSDRATWVVNQHMALWRIRFLYKKWKKVEVVFYLYRYQSNCISVQAGNSVYGG